ncbi:unnamed protein product, partial [Meganyctiphanes norvegica]
MEENQCMVCFSRYDNEDHRSRSLPCGHSMCTKCLGTSIRMKARMCPKCRTLYAASNVTEVPVNYPLQSVLSSLSIYKDTKGNDLPDCPEHQLQVSHRCSTHKGWICQCCLKEDHSGETCTIITVNEELNFRKSTKIDKSKPLLNAYKEACRKVDDGKKQCKNSLKECEEQIIRYENMIKMLQEKIKRKK